MSRNKIRARDWLVTVGASMSKIRKARGVTLRALSRAIAVSAVHLCDVEHGRRRPSYTVANAIAYQLNAYGLIQHWEQSVLAAWRES